MKSSSRSIVGVQTRPQGSPDLEAMPHQVTSLLAVFDTFTEKSTFFQKYTTPLKYSIKIQKLKNHHPGNLDFFWQSQEKIATRQKIVIS